MEAIIALYSAKQLRFDIKDTVEKSAWKDQWELPSFVITINEVMFKFAPKLSLFGCQFDESTNL